MKVKPFLLAFLLLNFSLVFARGFEPLGAKFYMLEDDELHVWDTLTKKSLKRLKIPTDTQCVNSLVRAEMADQFFKLLNKDTITKSIAKLHCMSLMVDQNEVMVTVRYVISKKNLKFRYALLKFDVKLKLLNYYVLNKDDNCEYFGFIPYSSPEFKSNGEFFYPNYRKGSLYLDGFFLDDKSHKIKLNSLGSEPIQHSIVQVLVSRDQLLNPIVNTVGNAHYNWVYEYPYPVIYTNNGKIVDPFKLKPLKDSLSQKENMFAADVKSFNPEIFKARTKHVVLCTQQKGQYLLMLTTDSLENNVVLLKVDLETDKVIRKSIQMQIGVNQFKFIGDRLYIVQKENNQFHVTYKYIEQLMNP